MAPEVSIRTDTWRVRASRTTITLLRMARSVGLEPTIGAMNADTRFPGEPTTNYRTTAYWRGREDSNLWRVALAGFQDRCNQPSSATPAYKGEENLLLIYYISLRRQFTSFSAKDLSREASLK